MRDLIDRPMLYRSKYKGNLGFKMDLDLAKVGLVFQMQSKQYYENFLDEFEDGNFPIETMQSRIIPELIMQKSY